MCDESRSHTSVRMRATVSRYAAGTLPAGRETHGAVWKAPAPIMVTATRTLVDLTAARRMTRAGLERIRHVFDHKQATKQVVWRLPPDIRRRLRADPIVWKHFQRFPESYRRIRIGWIAAARRRPEIFEQRLRHFIKMTARNKRFGMVQ